MAKAEVSKAFFASVFTSKIDVQESQAPEMRGSKEDLPLVEEDQVREYLSKLNIPKSMDAGGTHPQALRELALSL